MSTNNAASKNPAQTAVNNNPCGICRAMGFPTCKGHGGGGSGGGDSSETKSANSSAHTSHQQSSSPSTASFYTSEKNIWIQSNLLSDRTINYEAGLLSVESDKLRGTLIFRAKPGLSNKEIETLKEYLNAVKVEFESFKNQLTEQNIPTQAFTAVIKDNELRIHIPNPKYFDAFIKHLKNKNLLPIPNNMEEQKNSSYRTPSPFSTKLMK